MSEELKAHDPTVADPSCECRVHRDMRGEDWESPTGSRVGPVGDFILFALAGLMFFCFVYFLNGLSTRPEADRYEAELSEKYGKKIEAPESNKLAGRWIIDGEKKACTMERRPLKLDCELTDD